MSEDLANPIAADARCLLLGLYALGSSNILSFLLQPGQCLQSRCTDCGREKKLAPLEADLDLQMTESSLIQIESVWLCDS